MKKLLLIPALFLFNTSRSQVLFQRTGDDPLTLTQMQLQFKQWSSEKDLTAEHHWKYFKRWEMEMQMHTNASGEAADATEYLEALTGVAAEKQQASSSRMAMNAWYPVGPATMPGNMTGYMQHGIGRINCITFHPTNPNIYYVGVAQGGVWKTTNNGASWTPLTDNLPILRISDIVLDPNDPDNTIYLSVCDFEYIGFGLFLNGRKRNTHYGLGVYKSTDGGATWQATGLTFQLENGDGSLIRKIYVDPSNSNVVIACGVSGMYRSTDAGANWTQVNSGLFWDLLQDPVTPNILYAATGWVANANAGSAGILKSVDFGQTWITLTTGIPATGSVQRIKLAIAPSDPNYVYALAVSQSNGLHGFYHSVDAGANWTFIDPGVNILEWYDGSSGGGQGTYDLGFIVHPTNRDQLYAGGVNIWGSTDGAQTWDPASHWTLNYGPTLHCDIHFIQYQPTSGNYFVCSDGGIYRTNNIITQTWFDANSNPWPTQWVDIGSGLQITSFYRLSSSRNTTGRLIAGAQDNALIYYDNASWNTIFGGDGMDNYLDPLDDDFVIGSSQYGNFYVSYDDGMSYSGMYPNINNESGEWTTPLVADYNNPGTLYIGFENVVQSTDGGFSWLPFSNLPAGQGQEISAMAVSNSNSQVLYVTKRVRYEYGLPGILYKTTNGGNTWTDITAGLPDSLYYTSVEISETAANTAYVTMAGFSMGNKVFRTTDGGATWVNISYNLPNIPVNCIKYIPAIGSVLIATDIGVYTLTGTSTTWVNQSTGLPNVIISDIEFNVPLNKIYISTFGRGIWATDLDVFTASLQTEVSPELSLHLFPSPNNGTFTIQVPAHAQNESLQLEIIDIHGKIVHAQKLSGSTTHRVEQGLPPGMYFAKVRGATVNGVKSFIVQ
ncbi:MAG TPA: T9SS type A sorting domain-containing protein [Bacteroidia bacterium]|nr:T9SS type A sorting domain-containing protein [Bacteroidia bacterium]